ncbi:SPARC-like protein 1 [Alosa sapidissima]|uniref:SPARC-like protein 1 n=1 Tax=Alosa sapidissima TaxID=34773 RepID=UPI001C09ABDC|nr:SPARC-like protein 1 [Alosa sapidissima]
MKTHMLLLCLMASASVMCVRSKPHAKHHGISKHSQSPQEKDSDPEEPNEGKGSILPTFLPFEASSQGQEDEEVTIEGGQASEAVGFGEEDNKESGTPVLLSEEALAHLLQGSEEEQEEEQAAEVEEVAVKESEERESDNGEEVKKNVEKEEEDGEKEGEEEAEGQGGEVEKRVEEAEEESNSSTEYEIPMDLDYASDSDGSEPRDTKLEEAKSSSSDAEDQPEKEHMQEGKVEDQEQDGEEIPAVMADYDPETTGEDAEMPPKKELEEELKDKSQEKDTSLDKEKNSNDNKQGDGEDGDDALQEAKNSVEFRSARLPGDEGDKQEKLTNESSSHTKGKGRKQKKNQRRKGKGQMQGDQPIPAEPSNPGHRQMLGQEKTPDTDDNAVQRPKRRKSGKWAPMVGMNPVQIRATVELYPSLRPPPTLPGQGAESNPCENVRCKRGKVCKVNEDEKPVCVCQEAVDCPTSVTEFDHVCGTDNKTYDTSCQLFATKCNLEGTKKGHRLHLDYTGACKFIPPCLSTELAQFPLRMRDWLKNVLLQLYEHDTMAPGFLTPKQRARVQKIYESERRLHAGDHPIELLAQDFEKNYHMYIYPVHWQFAQMDQHPTDRYLSHSELAPLRVPLVPMEHCTSHFFQECDADKDKQVSFKEWGHCFGIKDEDMDTHLLF